MFGLEAGLLALLLLCIAAACAFEFVNGFHDTANAVATVIYTHSLKPGIAVVWSGFMNFLGVFAGGIGVAMGIVNLLPVESLVDQNVMHSIAMVLALLLSAIIWNLGTWWFGLPSSSTHTLVGSILGVGIAYTLLPGSDASGVNWSKTGEIGLSLLVSPLFGFGMTLLLMRLFKTLFAKQNELFEEPTKDAPPPLWIRIVLILTCTGVSFFHGSNDGQKGVGLVMLILIGVIPGYFALNQELPLAEIKPHLQTLQVSPAHLATWPQAAQTEWAKVQTLTADLAVLANQPQASPSAENRQVFAVRKDILLASKSLSKLLKNKELTWAEGEKSRLTQADTGMRKHTDYAPFWVVLIISLSLGLGTMVGWKRIVLTIGEKIGKSHLTYAQGTSAEIVAASTIGVSSGLGLPVSTTHVLSSGIAGAMVSQSGLQNLQARTVRSIALAWILTFPVSMVMAGLLFYLLRLVL